METSTLRPGLLVSLKTSTKGNVSYVKEVIEDYVNEAGERVVRWETVRRTVDPKEQERATKLRGRARTLVSGICADSAFGLLCPLIKREKLDAAIRDARVLVDEFNATATTTRFYFFVMKGEVASDDVEAVKSINSEMRDLLDDMEQGVKNLDVKMIREAAGKAKQVGQMLTPEAQARIQLAVDTVRATARQIVKAGEQAAQEIDVTAARRVAEVRTMFLDLDEAKEVAAPVVAGRAVDLSPTSNDSCDGTADYEAIASREASQQRKIEL